MGCELTAIKYHLMLYFLMYINLLYNQQKATINENYF